ncbi:MAG: 23S rRNA (adenine(2503)-C(2))-methyltransferase RlmN [Chloroflexi bacterium]|nr:23S rRNA (adenine(2503)-C(2))-methyltransferase RlmN [Chloroflexota bacterium]
MTPAPSLSNLLNYTRADLRVLMQTWGQPPYRGDQIYEWLHKNLVTEPEEMTNLPKALRARIAAEMLISPLELITQIDSEDGLTRKALFRLPDGNTIEVVLMLYNRRRTVCISTQVGCGMGCTFCATGQGGLARNLSAGEIIAQVHWFERWLRRQDDDRTLRVERPSRLTNVVVMGMGEPLANYPPLMQALRAIADPDTFALSVRNITISTVGLIPMLDRLREEDLPVRLAVSLHAPNNRLRNQLVPINKQYPLEALLAACHRYQKKTNRRISFEYALIAGVNDAPQHAEQLVDLLLDLNCHVNLIPLNPIPNSPYQPSPPDQAKKFQAILQEAGINTTMRLRRGIEISAGCGQLRQATQQPELIPLLKKN